MRALVYNLHPGMASHRAKQSTKELCSINKMGERKKHIPSERNTGNGSRDIENYNDITVQREYIIQYYMKKNG